MYVAPETPATFALCAAIACCALLVAHPLAAASPSRTPSPLRKVRDVVVYSDPLVYASFPSVVRRPDGELVVAFRRAPARKAPASSPIRMAGSMPTVVSTE